MKTNLHVKRQQYFDKQNTSKHSSSLDISKKAINADILSEKDQLDMFQSLTGQRSRKDHQNSSIEKEIEKHR